MKKFLVCLMLILLLFSLKANAENKTDNQHMVKEESYLKQDLIYTGLPDYPPFSYFYIVHYDNVKSDLFYESAFLKPIKKIAEKYGFKIKFSNYKIPTLEEVILDIRSSEAQLFFGAYSNTKLFTGIKLIYPASVSNPIHIITLPDTQEKIKTFKDLSKLKGVISKTEYLSDFVTAKIKPLNLAYLETTYNTYEALFTGEADYILGSLYYNKIMASRYGIEQYLAFSSKPLFKIPTFVALSKLMPQMSLYEKDLSTEFSKPEFGNEVKQEILRIVNEEITKNQGIVSPAFAQKVKQPDVVSVIENGAEKTGGKVIEQKIEEKSIDDVLDGI